VSNISVTLVEAAAAGDRAAFEDLVEASWDRLVRLSRSVVGDGDAEDVVQEALLVAWRKLPSLADPTRFAAWASRIVFRRALRRRRGTRPHLDLEAVAEPAVAGDPAATIDVWRVMGRLAPRQRAVLHLTAVEGLTDSEIGAVLGLAAGSVRAHRRRARERVRRMLGGGAS